MGFNMKALKILVDKDYEDDGLYAITIWVDFEPLRYISISRDVFEEPDVIYIEAQDQIFGRKTTSLNYSISDFELKLYFSPSSDEIFHWSKSREVSIEINKDDRDIIQQTLKSIFQ